MIPLLTSTIMKHAGRVGTGQVKVCGICPIFGYPDLFREIVYFFCLNLIIFSLCSRLKDGGYRMKDGTLEVM